MLASEAYSSPSIILSGRRGDGTRYIIDDFREAYYWMKQNTAKEAKIILGGIMDIKSQACLTELSWLITILGTILISLLSEELWRLQKKRQ
jgi:hypothetical protein